MGTRGPNSVLGQTLVGEFGSIWAEDEQFETPGGSHSKRDIFPSDFLDWSKQVRWFGKDHESH